MCQWVLQPSGEVIARRTLLPLTVSEINSKIESEKQKIFLRILHKKIGTSHTPAGTEAASNRKANVEPYEDDEDSSNSDPDLEVTVVSNKEVNQQPYYDRLMHSEVTLQRDNLTQRGKVKERNLSPDGSAIGTHNDNHVLNSLMYDVEFEDGDVIEHMANIIGENMLARADDINENIGFIAQHLQAAHY